MQVPTASASSSESVSGAALPTPRTSRTPAVTARTPSAAATPIETSSATTEMSSTSTGAEPRAIGYANE